MSRRREQQIEITRFRKHRGVLSKEISLDENGEVQSDGSACRMAVGTAYRERLDGVEDLAELINDLASNEAIALGRLRAGLPDRCEIVTKNDLNGKTSKDTIARSQEFLEYAPGKPAFMLLDHDRKGMPADVKAELKREGGFWKTLVSVFPELEDAASVERRSTSAALFHERTKKPLGGSLNRHVFLIVKDGSDVERALKTIHDRLWLAGCGFYIVGAIGQFLDRSLIDTSVFGPERLVFEGPPILVPPVAQDARKRIAKCYPGEIIDTLRAFPPLAEPEAQRLAELKAKAKRRLQPDAEQKRRTWVEKTASERGISLQEAERIAANAVNHVLEAGFELEFDDPDLGLVTVAEVLADGDTYIGETLADPLEGVSYGRGKAKLLAQHDGRLIVRSFAHGGCIYRLAGQGVGVEDFFAYMPKHLFIFAPAREPWPAASVNERIPPQPVLDSKGRQVVDKDGKPKRIQASRWLTQHRAVEQITWWPGKPMIISNQLIHEGGIVERRGVSAFNSYLEPERCAGDGVKAKRWIDHVRRVYPTDADHIIRWLAQRVQQPDVKVNHALVLGGNQGIGKDSILVPIKHAVGPWNFSEVSPIQVMGRFNGFLKSVILRISEARDQGDSDRFRFYDHTKAIIAAPPEVLRVDEKNWREHNIPNLCGVVITTNTKTGIHLDRDDRRHFVAWSDSSKEDFNEGYFAGLHRWFEGEGNDHVAAYLADLDISAFDAKAPPPQTPAFWAIVDAGQAPEDAEFCDALDALHQPDAVTLENIHEAAEDEGFRTWMGDRRNSRVIGHRMEAAGYVPVRNPSRDDGRWKIEGKRRVIYAAKGLSLQAQYKAASDLVKRNGERSNVVPLFRGNRTRRRRED